ncbi:SRPBCC family protein [Micromonospora sp. DT47]|uniref:SRPBCC family protein n=1 Tax=Micromonospora sp. DT47 TaxID=3393431 RepID=UPI003CF82D1E
MRFYEATSTIAAAPDAVWPVLVDGAAWPQWDSGVDGVEGRIALDQKIKIRSQAAPGRAFAVRVTSLEPERALRLSGGMPLGLFKGVRTYSLAPDGTGGTTFYLREEYSGPLLGLIWRSMPDLGPSFRQFAEGLKKRVESGR